MMMQSSSSGDSCTVSIVSAVARREGVDPTELPVLYDVIDPSQLEALIESADDPISVEFDYCGYTVVVDGDGTVRIDDPAEPSVLGNT